MYASAVTSYLYSLRSVGYELRLGIQALAAESELWQADLAIENRPNRYERLIRTHGIGYEVDRDHNTIRVIYIQPL